MPNVTSAEIADLLRKAIAGEINVRMIGGEGPWPTLGGYHVRLTFGDWELLIFNDEGAVDYIDRAVAPDGRVGDYDDWSIEPEADSQCPLRHLSGREVETLDALLANA